MSPGDVLVARFRIDGPPLGQGRSGVVWPAEELGTGRRVAVKVLHEALASDPAALSRLQAEAGVAARLRSPRIVPVVGVFSDGGRWLLVSERVEGRCLEEMLAVALAPEAVVALGVELAAALEHAHAAGVFHGDVRPGNVLVGTGGARLFDFAAAAAPDAVRPGETAPEVQAGAKPTARSDLYGLGIVLFAALAGRPAFDGPTPWARLGAQQQAPALPPGPHGLAALVGRLLDPDPSRRPATATEVRLALEQLRRDPERSVMKARRAFFAPVRLGGAWLVHGTDPATGLPALVRADLTARKARDLSERLRAEGWDVRAAREGLGGWDALWIVAFAVAGGAMVPVIGHPLGAMLGAWALSSRCEPQRRALPPVVATVPPLRLQPGTEHLVVAGGLLILTALLLQLSAWAALLPAVLACALLVAAARLKPRDVEADAARARIDTALEEVRRSISGTSGDEELALLGELGAIERERATAPADEVLARAESLSGRARARAVPPEGAAQRATEALRRTHAELTREGPPRA